jgi:hypothetical protein
LLYLTLFNVVEPKMSSADDPSDEAVAGMEEEVAGDVAEVSTESPQASAEVTSKQSKNSRKRTKTGCLSMNISVVLAVLFLSTWPD